MSQKATEDTITSILRDELIKRGINVELLPSLNTPVGLRKPDLLCKNGGIYLIEAKFSERNLLDAISKIQNDYLKHYKILGIKGGFAILYPKELTQPMPMETVKKIAQNSNFKLVAMFPPDDIRPFKVYEAKLYEISIILSDLILKPRPLDPSIDYIITSLRESALYLLNGLRDITSDQLESFFGGKEVFNNILQYEEGKYPVEELKSATAYLLVNQLLFYHVLSKIRTEFPEIESEKIYKPEDLNIYFNKVLEINYRMVFSYDVASLIPPKFIEQIKIIVNVISGLGAYKVSGDFLGTIFHDLIPFDVRKNVAAFYTNVLAAEMLAFLSIDESQAKVADFACGSGGLLVAAYRRKRSLLKGQLTQKKHRDFVDDLLGIDVMPFAANIAACHIALQAPQYFTDKINLAVWDSTDLIPGRIIPSVADLKYVLTGQTSLVTYTEQNLRKEKGVISLSGKTSEDIKLSKYDVVIMNPPFTRQERMPKKYKEEILTLRFKDYKDCLHGQLGYHGYFLLLADKFLDKGGRISMVLPATVLRVQSFEGIRKFIANNYTIEHIITTIHRSAFSESVAFREMLFIAKKGILEGNKYTKFTVLKSLPTTITEARNITHDIFETTENLNIKELSVNLYDYDKIKNEYSNWFKYVSLYDTSLLNTFNDIISSDKLISFSLEKQLIRGYELRKGIVTNLIVNLSEDRALKTNDIWILSDINKKILKIKHKALSNIRFSIPNKYKMPTIRRAAGIEILDITKELDYIIIDKWDEEEFRRFENIIGHRISVPLLKSIKKDVLRRSSHLFIVRRIDLSAKGSNALAFYSSKIASPTKLMWSLSTSDEEGIIYTMFLNSTINLLQVLILRVETRGAWIELSKYVFNEFKIIDINKLSDLEKKMIIDVFHEIKNVKLPSLLEQLENNDVVRRKIDKLWFKILGYNEDIDETLDNIYKKVAKEINILKNLMKEGK